MGKFARVFDLPNGEQVVYMINYDCEEVGSSLSVITEHDGLLITQTISSKNDELFAAKFLESLSLKDAVEHRDCVCETFKI